MDTIQTIEERQLNKKMKEESIPAIANSLKEISHNIARANILECLRGLYDSKNITADEYAAELRSLLKCYNFELDSDKVVTGKVGKEDMYSL